MDYHVTESACQSLLTPSSYAYRTDALLNSVVDDTLNCRESELGIMYTNCSHPIILTDSLLGPAQFNVADSSPYYHWNKENPRNQILFTFPTSVSVSVLQLYFYTDKDNGIALPKTRLSLVNDSFQVSDTIDESTTSSFTIDAVIGGDGENRLTNVSRRLTGQFQRMTTQVLLRIEGDKVYALALSEIKFCTGERFMSSCSTTVN